MWPSQNIWTLTGFKDLLLQIQDVLLKFIHSEKATKFCEIFPLLLTTVHTVKSKEKISQHFVAFSEYMNFIAKKPFHWICSLSTKHQTKLETPKPIIPWIRIWRVATGAYFSDTFDPQLGILQLLNHAAPPCKIKQIKRLEVCSKFVSGLDYAVYLKVAMEPKTKYLLRLSHLYVNIWYLNGKIV